MNILSNKKPQGDVNPAFEEDLKKVLIQIMNLKKYLKLLFTLFGNILLNQRKMKILVQLLN